MMGWNWGKVECIHLSSQKDIYSSVKNIQTDRKYWQHSYSAYAITYKNSDCQKIDRNFIIDNIFGPWQPAVSSSVGVYVWCQQASSL